MNLIDDPWIPARRKNGNIERIAPWQIVEGTGDNEIIELAAPRPDFNGALIQFLIGLLQTTYAPHTPKEWRDKLENPPSSQELKSAFAPVVHAFELDSDGPRFMQDLTMEVNYEDANPIGSLFIEAPGEQTLKQNKDHFVKRDQINQICEACAAAAIYTLQINAPSGGAGHRTGLRGGGPLTTLIRGVNLWQLVWLNVLEEKDFLAKSGNHEKDAFEAKFPWLGATRTSEGDKETTPEDVHPVQNYWATPRRIRLLSPLGSGVCDICLKHQPRLYDKYVAQNYGANYKGPWQHPLSPYFIDSDGKTSAIHLQPGGMRYKHWLGWILDGALSTKGQKISARVVSRYRYDTEKKQTVWAFGYDMDNMKARCWYEGIFPLIHINPEMLEEYRYLVKILIESAELAVKETRGAVKKAWFREGVEVRGDMSRVDVFFWNQTEARFYDELKNLRDNLESGNKNNKPLLDQWSKYLLDVSLSIFDDLSQTGSFDAVDPARIAKAMNSLERNLRSKKFRAILDLS